MIEQTRAERLADALIAYLGGNTATHAAAELRRLSAVNATLLAALQALTDWGRDHTSPKDPNSPHDLLIAARAAIALATGKD